jgi:hypothetical protein
MTTHEIEQHLMRLTLASKPLGEATFIKGIALLLAGLEAQRTGKLDPDHFEEFVVAYCLRSGGGESGVIPENTELDTCQKSSGDFALGVWAPWRQKALARSQRALEEAISLGCEAGRN